MLVLTRRVGERIVIGNDVELRISKICGNRVKVAIAAPLSVSIRRGEIDSFSRPAKLSQQQPEVISHA